MTDSSSTQISLPVGQSGEILPARVDLKENKNKKTEALMDIAFGSVSQITHSARMKSKT